jgi:hypothetical protein
MGESAAVADRVGVVGANPNRGWARDSHIPALRSLENVPLAAVATTSRASADAAAEAIGVGAGYDDPRCVVPCGVCVDRLIRRRVQVHVDYLFVSFGPTVGRPQHSLRIGWQWRTCCDGAEMTGSCAGLLATDCRCHQAV